MPCGNTNYCSVYDEDDFILVPAIVDGKCQGCYFDSIESCYPDNFPPCRSKIYVLKEEKYDCPIAMPILESKEKVNIPDTETSDNQQNQHDPVNKPKHYMLFHEKDIEVRDLMKVLADQLDEEYWHGMLISDYIQMMQYLLRWHRKNGLEDLEKAQWYLSKIIEQVKGTN